MKDRDEILFYIRKKIGLKELAEKLECSDENIYRNLRGLEKKQVVLNKILKIADAINCNLEIILKKENEEFIVIKDIDKLEVKIKEILLNKGISIPKLAQKMGLKYVGVYNSIRRLNKGNISLKTLNNIAEGLEYELEIEIIPK